MFDSMMRHPTVKALLATAVFALLGAWTFLYRAPQTPELLPQAIFYVILVINTFLSIQFYSRIQPQNFSQQAMDAALFITYAALALSLGRPLEFVLANVCLFALAPFKYMLMVGLIPYDTLLKRKIRIDSSGTALSVLILIATLAGYALPGAWALAALFAIANVYLLLISPMYRL